MTKTPHHFTITHDADRRTIRVVGLAQGAWMEFCYQPQLEIYDMSASIRFDHLITGLETPPWWEINAAWMMARQGAADLAAVPRASHAPFPARITFGVARYLGMLDRVNRGAAFTDEQNQLPALWGALTHAERRAVQDRLDGSVVL